MNKEHLLPIEKSRLGVIGGSGFYSMDQIEYLRELEINTPYGKPSDSIKVYNLGNLEIAFIPRHGRTHSLNPSEIPYKANIWALRSIGVRWIIAPSAVGSLQEQIRPLDIVVPDQFIDRTKNRPATFFNDTATTEIYTILFVGSVRMCIRDSHNVSRHSYRHHFPIYQDCHSLELPIYVPRPYL